jgi:hypothetical protein
MDEGRRLFCCDEPLTWKVAESVTGTQHALCIGVGIPVRLWRCTRCEQVTVEGWIPPLWMDCWIPQAWIEVVTREIEQIVAELNADLTRAYTA